jgi:hypothetical protein
VPFQRRARKRSTALSAIIFAIANELVAPESRQKAQKESAHAREKETEKESK